MATTAIDQPMEGSERPQITILKRQRQDLPISQNKFLKKTARGKILQCKPRLSKAAPNLQFSVSDTSAMISLVASPSAISAQTSLVTAPYSPSAAT